jgi:hypothetical protein
MSVELEGLNFVTRSLLEPCEHSIACLHRSAAVGTLAASVHYYAVKHLPPFPLFQGLMGSAEVANKDGSCFPGIAPAWQ